MMGNKFPAQTKNNFLGTPLGIILAIIFFPFFFTWWVYKRDWNPGIKWAFMLVFWLLVAISQITNPQQKDIISIPIQNISPIPAISINNLSFDKTRGNNYFSAKYARDYMDLANKKAPGTIKNVYLTLLPDNPTGITEEEYKKSTSQISLTIAVNPFFWNLADNPTKIKLLTTAINELKNTFSGLPHITITDGARTLAEASLPSLNSKPQITLK